MAISLPLFKPYFDEEMVDISREVLSSGLVASGKYVLQFEAELGSAFSCDYVLAVDNMTSGLQIALRCLGVGSGDKVLLSSFACLSTNVSVHSVGAQPLWLDLDPDTATINMQSLEASLSAEGVKAMIAYHVAGYPAEIDEVVRLCKKYGVFLIEDCNNAYFGQYNGKLLGTFGDIAVFSFYPNRLINTVEGGALLFKDSGTYHKAKLLRRFGIDLPAFRTTDGEIDPTHDVPLLGWAATLPNLNAGYGVVQLRTVSTRIAQIRTNVALYDELLQGCHVATPVLAKKDSLLVPWVYLIRTRELATNVLRHLRSCGIGCSQLHYLTSDYSGFGGDSPLLPGSRKMLKELLGIPCGWWLNEAAIYQIVEAISMFVSDTQ